MTMTRRALTIISASTFVFATLESIHAQSSTSGPDQKSALSDMARTPGVPTWGTGPGSAGAPGSSIGGLSELPSSEKRPGYGGPTTDLRSNFTSSGLGFSSGAGGGAIGAGVGRDGR
jgi:hypothetical protein